MTKYLNIFLLTITLLLYFGSGNATEKFPFEKVEIEAPFHNLLLHYPGFMQEGGARLFADHKGDLALIGIAKLVLEDSQPENILQIRRISEIRARAAILELRDGVEISTSRGLKEGSLPAR